MICARSTLRLIRHSRARNVITSSPTILTHISLLSVVLALHLKITGLPLCFSQKETPNSSPVCSKSFPFLSFPFLWISRWPLLVTKRVSAARANLLQWHTSWFDSTHPRNVHHLLIGNSTGNHL